jgi:uncharacterized protein YndB with AHSA1/START domain
MVRDMAVVACSTTIRAPREKVFAYRLDVAKLPEYNPDVVDLEAPRDGAPVVGAVYRFRVRLGPGFAVRTTLTIREVEPPRRLVFDLASLMDAREVCVFESDGDRTRVAFETTVQSAGGTLGRIVDSLFVAPSARRQMTRELELMKKRLEA